MKHQFPYNWTLKDAVFTKDKGTVFSCFACGGGSTMGYKLAGFDVLGCNEIDPKMIEAYKINHNPKYAYLEPIQTFKLRNDLPDELYKLDILDGSPPCSTFSISGNRQNDWGKEKVFKEGQAKQVLDTLFFDFIDLAKKLQPKVVIAENVKGLLMGEAKGYVRKIYQEFENAGYYAQHWLLDGSKMGLPQKRERIFFVALRNDLADIFLTKLDMFTVVPKLDLNFDEEKITFDKVFKNYTDRPLTQNMRKIWELRKNGDASFEDINFREFGRPYMHFNYKFIYKDDDSINTITGSDLCVLFDQPRHRNFDELCECGSYPKDYNFLKNKPEYLIGMSVPPVMTAQIAKQVYEQWLSKINH